MKNLIFLTALSICFVLLGSYNGTFAESASSPKAFFVGKLLVPDAPIPKLEQNFIYDYRIVSDNHHSGINLKLPPRFRSETLQANPSQIFFAFGTPKGYETSKLKSANPQIKWLDYISAGSVPVLVGDFVNPIVAEPQALKVSAPERASTSFEISITTFNPLSTPLKDSEMNIEISGGPFLIVDGSSYYTKQIKASYAAGETKTHRIRLELRAKPRPDFPVRGLGIFVDFLGYSEGTVAGRQNIQPLYAKWGKYLSADLAE